MRLGSKQLEMLMLCGVGRALVVGDRTSRRLCELGLMRAHGKDGDSIVAVTAEGLRALADASDAGRIALFEMPKAKGETNG